MEKYIKLIALIILMASIIKTQAQLPLKQGDIIITQSPFAQGRPISLAGCVKDSVRQLGAVVSIQDASNTSGIPITLPNLRYSWTHLTPGNNKPVWFSRPSWIENNLGRVFGLTIEDNRTFYVSNTSIYSGEGNSGHHDQIWQLDPTTNTFVSAFNFGGTDPNRGIGNIKYYQNGNDRYMLVTYWEKGGSIEILHKNSSAIWTNVHTFIPQFGTNNPNNNDLPYGVAVRRVGTTFQVYYGRFGETNNTTSEIWRADLNLTGGTSSIINESIGPVISTPVKAAANFYNSVCLPVSIPVSDISFSADFSKVLVAQQSLCCVNQLNAHNSKAYEYIMNPVPTQTSVNMGAGATNIPSPWANVSRWNSVGGVSYWNNILFRNSISADSIQPNEALGCDTTILFTADIIVAASMASSTGYPPAAEIAAGNLPGGSSAYVYGFQGMPSRNTASAQDLYFESLKVDADDVYSNYDKWNMGDIEAFNLPLNCNPEPICECGQWNSIALNLSPWWSAANGPVPPSLTFNQGQVLSGVLFPSYTCLPPNCTATYAYSVTSPTGANTPLTASAGGSLNLNQPALQNLPCGSYWLNITPTCGNIKCPPIRIPLVIICPPVCNCEGTVTISDLNNLQVVTQNNISNSNPVSTMSGSFTLNSSVPLTEVRMLIDEFRIVPSTGNANCLLCRNKPQTWASINSASLAGVGNQTLISPTITNDVREFIFSNGTNSSFSLSGNALSFNLGVPGVTGLNCCTLKAEVCIKFIFRDVKCCERELLKCFTFNIN